MVRGGGGVVWAYAGVLPRVVFSDDAKLVSSEVTVVPTGHFYGVVNFVFGALACFVMVRALPEHVLDGMPLIAVRACVIVESNG